MTIALVPLPVVTDWLNTSGQKPYPAGDNPRLSRLILAASAFATQYLSRPVSPATFSEVYDGTGTRTIPLRQTPIIAVRSLTVGTTVIAARASVGAFGYVASDSLLYLDGAGSWGGATFCRGVQNVAVTYDAGYQTTETRLVPASQQIDSGTLARTWNADRGVSYSSGTALTLVTTAPTLAGTYQVALDDVGRATYLFAAADVGQALVITYGFTPDDIVQALCELVVERVKTRDRIGEVSKNFGQMSTTYSQKDLNATARLLLSQYRNVGPF